MVQVVAETRRGYCVSGPRVLVLSLRAWYAMERPEHAMAFASVSIWIKCDKGFLCYLNNSVPELCIQQSNFFIIKTASSSEVRGNF